jgi:hypothetical protein
MVDERLALNMPHTNDTSILLAFKGRLVGEIPEYNLNNLRNLSLNYDLNPFEAESHANRDYTAEEVVIAHRAITVMTLWQVKDVFAALTCLRAKGLVSKTG